MFSNPSSKETSLMLKRLSRDNSNLHPVLMTYKKALRPNGKSMMLVHINSKMPYLRRLFQSICITLTLNPKVIRLSTQVQHIMQSIENLTITSSRMKILSHD